MADTELQSLRRRLAGGEVLSDREVNTFLRSGLGWYGEVLPVTLVVDPDHERDLYLLANDKVPGLDCMEFVYVPPREQPCPRCDGGRKAYVRPDLSHDGCVECHTTPGKQTLGGFYIGRYPVTVEEAANFPGDSWLGSSRRGLALAPGDSPLTNVSHDYATLFCSAAGLRLPTESEWQYAAFGPKTHCRNCAVNGRVYNVDHRPDGSTNVTGKTCPSCKGSRYLSRRYPWGDEVLSTERCIFSSPVAIQPDSPAPVKALDPECVATGCHNADGHWKFFPARPDGKAWCGAYDMLGNVWEFTSEGEALGGSFRSSSDELLRRRVHAYPRGAASVQAHFPDGRVRDVPPESFLHEPADDLGFRVVLDGTK